MRSLLRNAALAIPAIKRVYDGRESVEAENARLRAEIALLRSANPTASMGPPVYFNDFLAVWNKQLNWLHEPRFQRAYHLGMDTDHRIDTANPERKDINIEWRIHVCLWAAWHAQYLEGDFVECGTNSGIMSVAICDYLDFNQIDKNFYLFDTYAGIPEEQIGPGENHARVSNATKYKRDVYDTAAKNFLRWPRAKLVKGKIPVSLPTVNIEKVAYLSLDLNIMVPEKAALAYFWPKMVKGGIIVFDDYGWAGYPAQTNAHDEFAKSAGVRILTLPTGQGLLIKP